MSNNEQCLYLRYLNKNKFIILLFRLLLLVIFSISCLSYKTVAVCSQLYLFSIWEMCWRNLSPYSSETALIFLGKKKKIQMWKQKMKFPNMLHLKALYDEISCFTNSL